MVNGWKKKGKFLYEHDITNSWLGIKKRRYTSSENAQIDDFDRYDNKWKKDVNLWFFKKRFGLCKKTWHN